MKRWALIAAILSGAFYGAWMALNNNGGGPAPGLETQVPGPETRANTNFGMQVNGGGNDITGVQVGKGNKQTINTTGR